MRIENLKEHYNNEMVVYFKTDEYNQPSVPTRIKDLDRRFSLAFLDKRVYDVTVKIENGVEYIIAHIQE